MKKIFGIIVFIIFPFAVSFAQTEITKSDEKVVIDGVKYILHTVEPGQTLYSICKAYNVSIDEVNEVNVGLDSQIAVNQIIRIPILHELSDDGKTIVYVVKSGDTLYSLCKKYGISEDEFYSLNSKLKKGSGLKVGQEILFPLSKEISDAGEQDKDTINYYYHLVEKGETFYGLARKFNVTQQDILDANPDLTTSTLKVGDYIRIPRTTTSVLTDQQRMVDSLANINFNIDSSQLAAQNFCDTALWYKHGNKVVISMLLPFDVSSNLRNLYNQENSNKDQRLYPITEKILDFYCGFLVGLEGFISYDIKIELKVYDIGNDNNILADLISNNKFDDADLIIGPAFKSQADYFNLNFKDTSVAVILPFINEQEILEKYPNNILIKTSDEIMRENVAKYISQNPQNNYILIQGYTPDYIKLAAEFEEAMLKYSDTSKINFTTVKFNGKSMVSVKNLIREDKENVFILPFAHEAATMKIFTELFPIKKHEITVIGPEQVLSFESIDPNYYAKVKYSYFSNIDINRSDTLTKNFVSKYQETFLCAPDQYAFMAFDVANFFVTKLARHGRGFSNCLQDVEKYYGCSGVYRFVNKPSYARKSFSNSATYIFTLQEDFTMRKIYPKETILVEEGN
ncbi:MAG: LysM peptidoglycan-binding domain-containing protein [Bacteroidales bacterium]|nr:LysM peptidoglycan-binding domain-containing protein [Bacteroidales bacterium]